MSHTVFGKPVSSPEKKKKRKGRKVDKLAPITPGGLSAKKLRGKSRRAIEEQLR